MTTQIVFKIDPKIKARAMERARREGFPFAAVLKSATKAFADGRFSLELVEEITPQKMKLLDRESRLRDQGKGMSFASMSEFRKYLRSL